MDHRQVGGEDWDQLQLTENDVQMGLWY